MTHEAQPRQTELTGQGGNPTLNMEQSIFMSDAGINTEGNQPVQPVKATPPTMMGSMEAAGRAITRQPRAEKVDSPVGMFADSDITNPDTRSTLDLITELSGMPKEVRDAAQERLTEETGQVAEGHAERRRETARQAIVARLTSEDDMPEEEAEARVTDLSDIEDRAGGAGGPGVPPPVPGSEAYYTQEIERSLRVLERLLGARATTGATPGFSDTFLEQSRQQIYDLYRGRGARGNWDNNRVWLDRYANEVYDYTTKNPSAGKEGKDLMRTIREIAESDDVRLGKGEEWTRFTNRYDSLAKDPSARRELVRYVRKYVADNINPSGNNIPDFVLKRIIQGDDEGRSLDRLVIRITGTPLQSETGDYSLGFYGGINLETITNLLQSLSENPRLERDPATRRLRYDQLQEVRTIEQGMKYIHELNKFTVTDQLDTAAQLGNGLMPAYLNRFQRLKGVGAVMRYLEWAFPEMVSREGIINTKHFNKLTGQMRNPETGKLEANQDSSVFESFRRLVDKVKDGRRMPGFAGLKLNNLDEFADMEEWEVRLAYNIGRNLFNVEHRSVEWISQGIPRPGTRMWESPVMEGFVRILAFGKWMNKRFEAGKNRGGIVFFDHAIKVMQRLRPNKGYERNNKMQLNKIKGEDIAMFELANMTAPRGFWASWRAVGGLLRQMDAKYEPLAGSSVDRYTLVNDTEDITTDTKIGLLVDTDALRFEKRNSSGEVIEEKSWSDASEQMKIDYFRSVFLDPQNPTQLRPDLQVGLGPILRIVLGPSGEGKKHKDFDSLKEQIRTLIWERVAGENPLAIVPYLHGLKYSDKHIDPRMLTTNAVGKTVGRRVDIYKQAARDGIDWEEFSRKLAYFNEVKMAKIRGYTDPETKAIVEAPILNYSLQDAISGIRTATGVAPGTGDQFNLSPAEEALLQRIKTEGRSAAADLANVEFPFIPFLDVFFEKADYDDPGAMAVGRHFRDLGQAHASNQVTIKILDNPAQIISKDPHATVETFKEFEKGITGVHGDKTGKARLYPWIEAGLWFHRRGENGGNRATRFLRKQDEVHTILQKFHLPEVKIPRTDKVIFKGGRNSVAQQELSSYKLETLDLGQVFDYLELFGAEGLMGPAEEEEAKKRLGGAGRFGWLFILRMIWEGAQRGTKAAVIVTTAEVGKKSFDPKGTLE